VALTELLRILEDEARLRIEELLGQARADAERLRRESEAELTRRRAAALEAREAELRAAAAGALEGARRGATRRLLEVRAEALGRIRARAETRLAARAGDPALVPLLRRDLAHGLGYFGPGPVVVEADPALLDGLRGAAAGVPDVTFQPAPGRRGLVIRSADGSLTVDLSFESRLERSWPALAMELVRRLEGMA
jgi:vacuolar-type H+-ATPase subunit E/Vma4